MTTLAHQPSLTSNLVPHARSSEVSSGTRPSPSQTIDPAVPSGLPSWKRLFDLAFVLLASLIWLPVFLVIMAAIKLLSPGPIFYRQARVGYKGKSFMIYKFRSMKVNAETLSHEEYLQRLIREERPMTKLDAADPRLIPLGRLLRASGLDELPQIFNVLRGEMSLIGPRPCTLREFQSYQPWQLDRVNAFPGLTGFWQVNGKNKTTFNEMVAMDIHYATHLSPRLDLEILARTIPAILTQIMESWKTRPRESRYGVSTMAPAEKAGRL